MSMVRGFTNELERALRRDDAAQLRQAVETYYREWNAIDSGVSSEGLVDYDDEYFFHAQDHPDKALAFVMLAAAKTSSRDFLFFVAAGPLEDLLRSPSEEMIERVVEEARRTPRFRWMLTGVFPHAISERAWQKIVPLLTDVSEEDPMPPAPWV